VATVCPRPRQFVLLAVLSIALSLVSCGEDKSTNSTPRDVLDSPALLGSTTGSQNYIHLFVTAGVYTYHCKYHQISTYGETGTVAVNDGGPDSAFVTIFQGAYNPASVTVRPGGQVRWQNFDDGVHHTVTSD